MGFFDKLFGSDKIKVHFINDLNGGIIGVTEMSPDQLPKTFSINTTMHLGDVDWTVVEASPQDSSDFIKTKSLILKLRKVEHTNPKDMLYTLPTISNELPRMSASSNYSDFETTMHEDDWRQNEFLNKSSFPLVDMELSKIKDIWSKHSKKVDNGFTTFHNCHVRSIIGEPELKIDFLRIKEILKTDKIGSLKINDHFVENGFSIKTTNTTYYGINIANRLTHFCISASSEGTVEEIEAINRAFDLIFINWYHAEIIAE